MSKGGVDNLVRSEFRNLLMAHPYQHDRVEDGEWRNFYSFEDALLELYMGLSSRDFERVLAYNLSPQLLPRTVVYLAGFESDDEIDPQEVTKRLVKDFMANDVMKDPELAAMVAERDRRYQEYSAKAAALSAS